MPTEPRKYYLGDKNLPTGTVEQEYTPVMIKEMVSCAKDITKFVKHFWITTLEHGKQKIDLYAPQKRILKSLVKNRFNIILASRQIGKALDINTQIPTPNGWTTMGELKDNDIVFDNNGTPTKVVKAWDVMYDRPCYKITFDTGETITADEGHLWFTQNMSERNVNCKGTKKTTKELYETLYKDKNSLEPNHRIPIAMSGVSYKEVDLDIDPYVLGLWIGDGSVDNSRITVGNRDLEELVTILQARKQFDSIKIHHYKNRSSNILISSKANIKIKSLSSLLRKNNLLYNKHIPIQYMQSSRNQRLELLCGLMDSDGYISKRGIAEFYNTNLKLVKQVQELVRSLGYKATYREKDTYCNKKYCGKCGIVTFTPIEPVAKLSFKRDRITNKEFANNSKHRAHWHYIKNIEPTASIPVRCITVDSEDSMFLCGNSFISTSNTTLMTIYALWIACFQKDKTILIVANKEDTAKEILSRIKMAYEQLPNWLKPGVEEWAKTEVKFSNDSRIRISTTASSAARGLSINCLIIDEMAFIPEHIIGEFWNSVVPVISSYRGTKVFVVSTPNGAGNLFHKIYSGAERGDPDFAQWNHERVDWWEIPGRGKKWEIEMRSLLASEDKSFDQEFGCMFLETGHSAVDANLIELYRAISMEPQLSFENGHYKIWETPDDTHLYVIGVDVGEGIGQAASVAQILDITDLTDIKLSATYHNNQIDPFHFGEVLYKIANQWGRPMLAIERNNCGGQVIDALKQTHSYHNIIDHTPKTMSPKGNYYSRLGIYSHTNAKYQAVINMRYWVNSLKVVKVYDIALVQELETFVRYPNGTWKGKPGDYIYDDRVMALIWGLFVLEKEIAEKYYEIPAFDERGKPAQIKPVTVEESKYFKLDPMFINDPNAPLPTYINTNYGADPFGVEALESQGWQIL